MLLLFADSAGPRSLGVRVVCLRTGDAPQPAVRLGHALARVACHLERVAAYWATMLLAILPTLLFYIPMILFSVLASHGGGPHHAGPAEPWRVALLLGSFALMMVGWFLAMAWIFFLQTRTMFILPLIADRGLGFFDAWRTSWQETRRGFWELLLLQFLAGLIGAARRLLLLRRPALHHADQLHDHRRRL